MSLSGQSGEQWRQAMEAEAVRTEAGSGGPRRFLASHGPPWGSLALLSLAGLGVLGIALGWWG